MCLYLDAFDCVRAFVTSQEVNEIIKDTVDFGKLLLFLTKNVDFDWINKKILIIYLESFISPRPI